MLDRLRNPWSDNRAELTLGAVSLLVCASRDRDDRVRFRPRLADLRAQRPRLAGARRQPQDAAREYAGNQRAIPPPPRITCAPGRSSTGRSLTTGIAVVLGIVIAVLSSIFIVELAPARLRRVAIPVIRLLASVPSVIYGLIGDPRARAVRRQPPDLASAQKTSVQNSVELTGEGLLVVTCDP